MIDEDASLNLGEARGGNALAAVPAGGLGVFFFWGGRSWGGVFPGGGFFRREGRGDLALVMVIWFGFYFQGTWIWVRSCLNAKGYCRTVPEVLCLFPCSLPSSRINTNHSPPYARPPENKRTRPNPQQASSTSFPCHMSPAQGKPSGPG